MLVGNIIATAAARYPYFQSPAKSSETFRNGWIHTGDLGSLDANGFLFIRGRVKDMIISGGQNVHSAEVEAALLSFTGVAECAVIGLPDKLWGEAVTAIVVPRPNAEIDLESLRRFCRERLAGFKTPKHIYLQATALPRTPTGKIRKFLLVEQYGSI
jgi:fatty-acyl-CoA synthase